MNGDHQEMTDEDREHLLRLVLNEVEGADVRDELERFPADARSMFRRVVLQAGLVKAKGVEQKGTEAFLQEPKLSEKGRRRLKELNERLGDSEE